MFLADSISSVAEEFPLSNSNPDDPNSNNFQATASAIRVSVLERVNSTDPSMYILTDAWWLG
jgi:hypothetical protein